MAEEKDGSAFGRMMGGNLPARGDVDDGSSFVPRVVYTSDAKVDLSKLDIPRLRLAQGMTPEVGDKKAQIGQYVLTNFPAMDEVKLVPFAAQSIRFYKPDPKKPPQCQAPQGDFGFGDPGGVCAECPLSKWGVRDPKTGRASSPPCTEAISMRAYSLSHRSLVDFVFDGRRASKGAFIQQQAMTMGYAGFVITLRSGRAENDRGQWYEPDVIMEGEVPEEHTDNVHKWYELFRQSLPTSEEAHIQLTPVTT